MKRSTGLALPDLVLASARTAADLITHLSTARCETTASTTSPGADETGEGGWIEDTAHAGPGTRLWHQAQIAAGAAVGRDCTCGHTLDDQLHCPNCHRGYTRDGEHLSACGGHSCCDSIPTP